MHEGASMVRKLQNLAFNDSLLVSLTKILSDFLLRLSVRYG